MVPSCVGEKEVRVHPKVRHHPLLCPHPRSPKRLGKGWSVGSAAARSTNVTTVYREETNSGSGSATEFKIIQLIGCERGSLPLQ